MNNFLKNSSVFFIFVLMLTNLYALKIESITSNATEKGILGVGDEIIFEIRLDEPIEEPTIEPKEYNGGELKWETEDHVLFYATYEVKEGHSDTIEPLQLEKVTFCKSEGECTEPISGEDVYKTIDATAPELELVRINKINKNNYNNYTIEADLINPEDYGMITYKITDEVKNIVEGEIKLEETLETEKHIVIHNLNLSSLVDGEIIIKLKIIDDGLNKFEFEEKTTKIIVVPEISKASLVNINLKNEKDYSFEIDATGNLKNAKIVGTLKNVVGDYSITFERTITEQSATNKYSITAIDTTKLREGGINIKLEVIDAAENISKAIEEAITKDVIIPEIVLEKERIFSNSLSIMIKGTVIDKLNERVKVTQKKDGAEEKECKLQYSSSNTDSYTYVICDVELEKDGEEKFIITTIDKAGNFSEKVVYVKVNTSTVSLDFDNGLRIVTSAANSPKEISGSIKLNTAVDANSTYFATLRKLKVLGSKRYDLILKGDGTFVIDLEKPTSGTQPAYPLDGTYILTVYLSDIYGNKVTAYQRVIVDSVAPELEINNLETTNRTPELTGTVIDDLEKEVKVTINNKTYDATIEGNNWKVQITEELPLGTQAVKVIATDEASNQKEVTKEGAVTVNLAPTGGGGGIRILPAAVPAPVETPAPVEEPVQEPAPVQTPEPEENTNTGGENLTPVETPIEEVPQLEETPIETPTPSGLTGFAGFASSPGGVVTIVGGALVVIGAIGYFFFLRPR